MGIDQIYRSKDDVSKKEKAFYDLVLGLKTKDVAKYGINKLQLIRMKNKIKNDEHLKPSSKTRKRLEGLLAHKNEFMTA